MTATNQVVAGYCRVSSKSQIDNTSIQDQRASIEAECKSQKWQLYKIYEDGGLSGRIEDRPAIVQLLKDAKAKKFSTVCNIL